MQKISWIGAGYTAQKFKNIYSELELIESHRSNLNATESGVEGDLIPYQDGEALIFSLPPSEGALVLLDELKFKGPMILLSSIGVYEKTPGEIIESSSLGSTDRAKLIRSIEMKFLENQNAVVLRLGGLYDEDRHPLRFILKNNSSPKGEELINFVHIVDVCVAIKAVLDQPAKKRIYNTVDTGHPTKKLYYSELAQQWGENVVEFSQDEGNVYRVLSHSFLDDYKTPENFLNRI